MNNSKLSSVDNPKVLDTKIFETFIQEDIDSVESDDGLDDISDLVNLPELSTIRKNVNIKEYHSHLPIDNGIYEGLMNNKMIREGFGIYSVNNGEEYFAGLWKDDKRNGDGYWMRNNGSTSYYGNFKDNNFHEGYGKEKLKDGYTYEGKYENNKFNGLGELSIKIDGISSAAKSSLKVIADWNDGKIATTYLNEIKCSFDQQYEVFNQCLQSISRSDDLNSQRIYFKSLIELLEKGLISSNLLIEITKQSLLPRDLKISSDLLVRLDKAYESLNSYMQRPDIKKSFRDCVRDACVNGISIYSRRLQWFEYDPNAIFIRIDKIFESSLKELMSPSNSVNRNDMDNFKKVLFLDPLIIELVKKMVRIANERIYQLPSQFHNAFIHSQTNKIKSIWMDYLGTLKQKNNLTEFDDMQSSEISRNFFTSAYYSILNNCDVVENSLEIEFKNTSLIVNLNGEFITQNDKVKGITMIVIHNAKKKYDVNFSTAEAIISQKFLELTLQADANDIIIIAFSSGSNKILNDEVKASLLSYGVDSSTKSSDENFSIVLIQKRFGKINEKISRTQNDTLHINQQFKSEITENVANKDLGEEVSTLRHDIDILTFDSMDFVLNNLKPWHKIDFDKINKFFNEAFSKASNISIKKISDKVLLKILNDSKKLMLQYKDKQKGKNQLLVNDFERELELLVTSYEISLDKDKSLNYEFRIKEINEIISYFLSILCVENDSSSSFLADVVNIQLQNIKVFINSKENISKLIQSYVDFNSELKKINAIFTSKFSNTKFEDKTKDIINSCKKSFIIILNARDETSNNSESELSAKFFGIFILTNFLNGLSALDYNYYIEKIKLSDEILRDRSTFELIQNDKVKVLSIQKATKKVDTSHALLESVSQLLSLILTPKFLQDGSTLVMNLKARAEFINSISKSFKYFKDQVKYASLDAFVNDCIQPYVDTIKEKCLLDVFVDKLQKIELYFLYNRKLREITVEKALEMFKQKNSNTKDLTELQSAYKEYDEKFTKYFKEVLEKKISIDELVEKSREKAKKWTETTLFQNINPFSSGATPNVKDCKQKLRVETIPAMLASISVVYSLNVSNIIEKDSQNKFKLRANFNEKYFLKPHCIQILGILRILAIDSTAESIPNHLVEILTGQGKSWALALLAAFYSIIGYDVTVACYSDYLSRRDKADFVKYMEPFKLRSKVNYKTFEALCDDKLHFDGAQLTLRELISSIISGKDLPDNDFNDKRSDKSILLVDEVDVFFSESFGQMYSPCTLVYSKALRETHKLIWENFMNGKNVDEIKNIASTYLLKSIDEDKVALNLNTANVLDYYLMKMLKCAEKVYLKFDDFKYQYTIIDNMLYRRSHDGEFVCNTYLSYYNCFVYLKLMYDQKSSFENTNLNEYCYGYLNISTGRISYSELPRSYDGIFGVSGSLATLSNGEKSLLKHYDIDSISFYPSFFGNQKVKFNPKSDFRIEESEAQWYEYIVSRSKKILKDNRALLIFFNDEKLLDGFRKYSGDLGAKPYYVTRNKTFDGVEEKRYKDADVNKLIGIEYAGHHGSVTLLTKEFGRGVDFQVEAKVVEQGGLHVIQAFYSMDIKEEIQIKGRTARKDDPGSYEIILCLQHLKHIDIKGWPVEIPLVSEATTYEELDSFRRAKIDEYCSTKTKSIEANKQTHDKTIEFYKRALSNCNNANRIEFIKEIKNFE